METTNGSKSIFAGPWIQLAIGVVCMACVAVESTIAVLIGMPRVMRLATTSQ